MYGQAAPERRSEFITPPVRQGFPAVDVERTWQGVRIMIETHQDSAGKWSFIARVSLDEAGTPIDSLKKYETEQGAQLAAEIQARAATDYSRKKRGLR
jgi:hypothetical protein